MRRVSLFMALVGALLAVGSCLAGLWLSIAAGVGMVGPHTDRFALLGLGSGMSLVVLGGACGALGYIWNELK